MTFTYELVEKELMLCGWKENIIDIKEDYPFVLYTDNFDESWLSRDIVIIRLLMINYCIVFCKCETDHSYFSVLSKLS